MGLGDFGKHLGDAWDSLKDGGTTALGVAMDYAKTASEAGSASFGGGGEDYDRFFADARHSYEAYKAAHRGTTSLVGHAMAPIVHTGEALQYATNKGQRVVTTYEILNDPSRQHGGVLGTLGIPSAGELSRAWRLSNRVTPGQAFVKNTTGGIDRLAAGDDPTAAGRGAASRAFGIGDTTWNQLHDVGERGDDKFSPAFSWASGTLDAALVWYADPVVVGGKAFTAARRSRNLLRAGDLTGAEIKAGVRTSPASLDLTRRQKKVSNEIDSMVEGLRGKSPSEAWNLSKTVRESNNGAALASLISQADTHEQGVLVWLTAQGSTRAKEALVAQRADLGFKIDRMQSDLDNLILPETPSRGGLIGDALASQPRNKGADYDALDAEIKSDTHSLDLLDRAIGDQRAMDSAVESNTLLGKDQAGVFNSLNGRRARISLLDELHARGASSHVIQSGLGGIPIRVAKAPFTRRPHGWVDAHDAEAVVEEIDRMTKSGAVRGLSPERRARILDRAVKAQDDNARALAVQHTEDELINHIGAEFGYAPGDVQKLVTKMRTEQQIHLRGFKERAYGIAEDGSIVRSPLSETQLANALPTIDLHEVRRVLRREQQTYKALKFGHRSFDVLEHAADQFNDLWKLGVLFRLGYIQRNVMDNQFRIFSVLGAREALREHAETLGYSLRGPLKADARVERVARLQKIRDQLAQREEGSVRLYRGSHEPLDPSRIPEEGTRFTTQRDYAEQYGGDKFLYQIDVPKSKMQNTLFSESFGTGPLPHTMLDRATAERARLVRAPEGHVVHPESEAHLVDDPETAGLREEIAAIEAELSGSRGLKSTEVGPYDVAHPYGRTAEEADLNRKHIGSEEQWASLAAETAERKLNDLRGSGDWITRPGTDPLWEGDYLRVVNQHLRQGEISRRLMAGEKPSAIVGWLKSSDGRALRRRLGHGHDSPEDLVRANIENLNHVIPDQGMQRVFAERAVTPEDIQAMFPNHTVRPVINAEQVAFSLGRGKVADALNNFRASWFKFANAMPDDILGRHPMYRALYRGHMQRELHRLDPHLTGEITAAEQRVLEEQARIFARREMKRIMFDASNKSNLGHFLRFTTPFYTAWEDVIRKYGRMVMQNPSLIPHAWQLWTAPNDASFLEVKDATTGKTVPGSKSRLGNNEMIILPAGPLKALGLHFQPKLSKGGFNVVLQGDNWYQPGAGPMVQVSAQDLAVGLDSPTVADAATKLGILPFGVQDKGTLGLRYFLPSTVNQLMMSDAQKGRLYAMVLQTETYKYNKGERDDPPKAGEIKRRVNALIALRTFTSFVSPTSVQYASPYQLYIDQAHAMDEKYGLKGAEKFYDKHGDDLYLFTLSMSENNTGIRPSLRADRAAKKYSDLIAEHPEYGWFYVGPDNKGEYNRNVYNLQSMRQVSPTSTKTYRGTYEDPFEALKKNNSEIGWIKYSRMSDRLEQIRKERSKQAGMDLSWNTNAMADLRDYKQRWIQTVIGDDGPKWGKDWYDDYQERDEGSIRKFLEAARAATKDDRLANRPDIRTMGTYLSYRDRIRKILAARKAAGGSGTLTGNPDVADIWGRVTATLLDQNVTFGDIFHRYLENDDLGDAA